MKRTIATAVMALTLLGSVGAFAQDAAKPEEKPAATQTEKKSEAPKKAHKGHKGHKHSKVKKTEEAK